MHTTQYNHRFLQVKREAAAGALGESMCEEQFTSHCWLPDGKSPVSNREQFLDDDERTGIGFSSLRREYSFWWHVCLLKSYSGLSPGRWCVRCDIT